MVEKEIDSEKKEHEHQRAGDGSHGPEANRFEHMPHWRGRLSQRRKLDLKWYMVTKDRQADYCHILCEINLPNAGVRSRVLAVSYEGGIAF
jgi:hypothetical protein